jgi:hypothetical protein
VNNGLEDATNISVVTMETFNGFLYAGTYGWNSSTNLPDGCEIWRTVNGADWTKVVTDSFGISNCRSVNSLMTFGDSLYAGLAMSTINQTNPGGQVWRCTSASGCDQASDWTQVTSDGFGNPKNTAIDSLRVFGGKMVAITVNSTTGMEVWKTIDGATWRQSGFAGFGDSNNGGGYWDNSAAVFKNDLFVSTSNWANAGEIWSTVPSVASITRLDPNPSIAASLRFTVTFSEPVTGVDEDDFFITASGITGAAITGVSGSDALYTVTVSTGSGYGTLRLDLLDDDTIQDLAENHLGGLGARNGDFITGAVYTLNRAPGAFNKLTPVSGSAVKPSQNLTWGASTDASSYEICYDTSNDNACATWVSTGTATSKSISGLINGATYYWQVRARNGYRTTYANVASTSFWSFKVDGTAPKVTAITRSDVNPSIVANNAPLHFTVRFSEPVTGVDVADFKLIINGLTGAAITGEIIGSGTLYTVTASTGMGGGTLRLSLLDNDTILDSAGNPLGGVGSGNGSYSIGEIYTIRMAGAFNKSSPGNGSATITSVILSWGASSGASSYEVCYDTTNDSACSTWVSTGTDTRKVLSGLTKGVTYYWQARAKNTNSSTYANGSPISFWSFKTTLIPSPTCGPYRWLQACR